MSVEKFPVKPKNIRGKGQLVWWLRELADLVEKEQLEIEPHAALLLFVGEGSSELLHVGGLSSRDRRNALIKALRRV